MVSAPRVWPVTASSLPTMTDGFGSRPGRPALTINGMPGRVGASPIGAGVGGRGQAR